MNLESANLNSLWADLLVEELVRNGVRHFCVASGSRSSPLTVAIARNGSAASTVHVDERGAAFFAVGYARATGVPAAVVTTSGTAAANLLPAVVEASMDFVPMILLTADRPPELRDTCANQTIRQPGLFGDYVRWDVDLPCPTEEIPAVFVLSTTDHAVHRASGTPRGPVHINAMFREPLAPDPDGVDRSAYLAPLHAWLHSDKPRVAYVPPDVSIPASSIDVVERAINGAARGLVLVGGLGHERQRIAAARFLNQLQWPVCADVTSGLRLSPEVPSAISYYDLLLLRPEWIRDVDVVLQLGGPMVSKRLAARLREHPPRQRILVAEHAERQDPDHQVDLRVQCDPALLCDALAGRALRAAPEEWRAAWTERDAAIDGVLESECSGSGGLTEPAAARQTVSALEGDCGLVLANSMPVRDVSMFAAVPGRTIRVASNRGASGIDGTIATACGFAAGLGTPVTVLLGDLALLHDLNSLLLVQRSAEPVRLVVINNNGGGIFHFLPIAAHEDVFETYFGTPHGLRFEHVASQFELSYSRPETIEEFASAYEDVRRSGRSALIEVVTDRRENVREHRRIEDSVRDALDAPLRAADGLECC